MVSSRIPHDVKMMHSRAKDPLIHPIGIGDRLTQRSRSLPGQHLGDNAERCDFDSHPDGDITDGFSRLIRREKILTGAAQL